MPTFIEYNVGMKSTQKKQYTVRNLEPELDKALREQSQKTGKSLNEVVLETLKKGVGLGGVPFLFNDLDFLSGSWQPDPECEEAIQLQHQIDTNLWP